MRKIVAVLLVFSLLLLSGSLYAEKKGAELVVVKLDGKLAIGELITVKKDSLLLMEKESGADISVRVGDINKVTIIKKSKTLLGAGIGFLAGAGIGALGGLIGWDTWSWAPQDTKTKYRVVAGVGAIVGLIGATVGALIMSDSKTIQIEGKSDSEIKQILEDLRKKARIPDFQ